MKRIIFGIADIPDVPIINVCLCSQPTAIPYRGGGHLLMEAILVSCLRSVKGSVHRKLTNEEKCGDAVKSCQKPSAKSGLAIISEGEEKCLKAFEDKRAAFESRKRQC